LLTEPLAVIRGVYPFTALSRATVWLACLLVLVFNNAAGSDTLVELEGESIDSGSPRMRVLLDLGAQEHGVTVEQYKQQLAEEQSDQRIVDKGTGQYSTF